MQVLNGKYTSAKIFTDTIEEYALAQLQLLVDHPAFQGSRIRIMPDVHPGKVGTIGFTATVTERILPSVVGNDIGCGMTLAKLKNTRTEFPKLDVVIRENVPSGASLRKRPHRFGADFDLAELLCAEHINLDRTARSLGTLGGGNHFLELDQDEEGNLYVVIHSGSRHLGTAVMEYYLTAGQRYLKKQGIDVPYELVYLEGSLLADYIHDVKVVQKCAQLNRDAILDELIKGMQWKVSETYSCAHNYIDTDVQAAIGQPIIRKGAISAKAGESVIIPINMRDGVILGTGIGNEDWNYSAPHGAGRIMKRQDVKVSFTVSQYKKEMKGIYSSCIGKGTLDEAPFAYRSLEQITDAISETVKIDKILKPVYNFKAGGE
ncbi:MAG: RtcB family protein [Acetatifactor sp.]|nr:RtcB family protein [Acetatifactor sp.]